MAQSGAPEADEAFSLRSVDVTGPFDATFLMPNDPGTNIITGEFPGAAPVLFVDAGPAGKPMSAR